MNLYIDLTKAVQVPNTATEPVSSRRNAREYNESFDRQAVGVNSPPDDKERTDAPQEESLDDTLEEDRKLDTQIAQERGIVGKPEAKEEEKSLAAADILKSLTGYLQHQLDMSRPNEREVEYLTTQCGYSTEDVMKGRARITGSERSRFNEWLHGEFQKSVGRLSR